MMELTARYWHFLVLSSLDMDMIDSSLVWRTGFTAYRSFFFNITISGFGRGGVLTFA